jgi:hypothetical protein
VFLRHLVVLVLLVGLLPRGAAARSASSRTRRAMVPRDCQDFTCQESTASDGQKYAHVLRRNLHAKQIECVAASQGGAQCLWYATEEACNEDHATWNPAALAGWILSCEQVHPDERSRQDHWCNWHRTFLVPLRGAPVTRMLRTKPKPADKVAGEAAAAGQIIDGAPTVAARGTAGDNELYLPPLGDPGQKEGGLEWSTLGTTAVVVPLPSPSSTTGGSTITALPGQGVQSPPPPKMGARDTSNDNFTAVFKRDQRYFLVDVEHDDTSTSSDAAASATHSTWSARIIPSAAVAHELGLWPVRWDCKLVEWLPL